MKQKRIIPVFFILILSLFPTLPFVESAGYGEENENLDQFTDDFENDDNVSVAVNVINNQTLDCMELNYSEAAEDPYENLTTWVEDDGDGDLTVIPSTCTFTTMRRDSDSLIYFDGGAGSIDDFMINFTLQITDLEAGDASNIIQMWAFAVGNGNNRVDIHATDGILLALQQVGSTDDIFRYVLRQREGGAWQFTISDGTDYGLVTHYLTLIRTGTNVTLNIYSDEARTTLIEHLSEANGAGTDYRYYLATVAYDVLGDPADHASGNVRNVSLGVGFVGYYPDGYFTTEDYLNYTTGQGLALLTNASIPEDTSMTVQFSNDNATWVDNEGNVGSTPVLDGFYAIDLRDLNYTDSFKMYNLTTTDSTITPRLFQSRLVTTNGTAGAGLPGPTVIQNVTGEWVYYNLTTINVTVGTHDSGDLNSTLDIDGDTYNCSEVVGAPGYVIEFEWIDVDQDAHCLWVTTYIFYDGVSAHTINIDLWNFTAPGWVTIGTIYDMTGFEWVNSSIYDLRMPNDFINSTGAVRGRFYHSSAGNINDDIHTDFLKLYAFIPFEDGAITEQSFFWVFIAIVLSIIVGLLMWLKYEHNNN